MLIHCSHDCVIYMHQQLLLFILQDIPDHKLEGIDDLTRIFDELRSQLAQKQHELEVIVHKQYTLCMHVCVLCVYVCLYEHACVHVYVHVCICVCVGLRQIHGILDTYCFKF